MRAHAVAPRACAAARPRDAPRGERADDPPRVTPALPQRRDLHRGGLDPRLGQPVQTAPTVHAVSRPQILAPGLDRAPAARVRPRRQRVPRDPLRRQGPVAHRVGRERRREDGGDEAQPRVPGGGGGVGVGRRAEGAARNSYPHHTASRFPFVPHATTHFPRSRLSPCEGAAGQPDPRGLRQREDGAQQQLVALRQADRRQLRPRLADLVLAHPQLLAREVEARRAGASRGAASRPHHSSLHSHDTPSSSRRRRTSATSTTFTSCAPAPTTKSTPASRSARRPPSRCSRRPAASTSTGSTTARS